MPDRNESRPHGWADFRVTVLRVKIARDRSWMQWIIRGGEGAKLFRMPTNWDSDVIAPMLSLKEAGIHEIPIQQTCY